MAGRSTLVLTVDGTPCHVPRKQRVSYVPENPKQRGSAAWERYQKYKGARTLEEALQRGATAADFHFDLSRGFMRILFLKRGGRQAAGGAGATGKLAARARRLLRRPAASAGAGRRARRATGPALLPVRRAFGDSPPRGVGAAGPPVLHVLSLGSRCLVARALSDLGLRRYAGPLDWVYSNTEMVRCCLKDGFAQFLETRNLVPSGSAWGHKVYGPMLGRGVVFPHHEPRTRDRIFFQRAVSRFQQVVASSERKLLVLAVPVTKMESPVAQDTSAAGDAVFAEASQLFADLRGHGVRNFELLVVLLVAPGASVCSGRRPGVLPPRVSGCPSERLVLVELHCAGEQTGVNFRADEDERAFRALVRGPPGRQRRFQLQADPLPPRSGGAREAAGRAAPARRMALGEVREPPGVGGAKRRRR